eukprot:7435673-Lingulodinium_polyedra.AAC.1
MPKRTLRRHTRDRARNADANDARAPCSGARVVFASALLAHALGAATHVQTNRRTTFRKRCATI